MNLKAEAKRFRICFVKSPQFFPNVKSSERQQEKFPTRYSQDSISTGRGVEK
jgi:hypothetical protein